MTAESPIMYNLQSASPRQFIRVTCQLLLASWLILAQFSGASGAAATPVLTGTTATGIRIEIYSDLDPLLINQIHTWHIRVLDANGAPLQAQMSISGGMPEHDHGMPTAPQITRQLDNGDYQLEGMRFHMPGLWQLLFELTINGAEETAVIDFRL